MVKTNFLIVLFGLLIGFSSCVRGNMYTDRTGFLDHSHLLSDGEVAPVKIRAGDKFSLSVWKHESLSIGSIYGIYNSNQIFGKWQIIRPDSTIVLPELGKVKLGGLSIIEAENFLTALYSKYIVNPIVTIQIHSHAVELLGQIKTPSQVILFNNKHTITEALALVGGHTEYAQLSKTVLTRAGQGYVLDLTRLSPAEIASIYLKPGDVIYIPAKRAKTIDQKSSILLAAASIITTLLIILRG